MKHRCSTSVKMSTELMVFANHGWTLLHVFGISYTNQRQYPSKLGREHAYSANSSFLRPSGSVLVMLAAREERAVLSAPGSSRVSPVGASMRVTKGAGVTASVDLDSA